MWKIAAKWLLTTNQGYRLQQGRAETTVFSLVILPIPCTRGQRGGRLALWMFWDKLHARYPAFTVTVALCYVRPSIASLRHLHFCCLMSWLNTAFNAISLFRHFMCRFCRNVLCRLASSRLVPGALRFSKE